MVWAPVMVTTLSAMASPPTVNGVVIVMVPPAVEAASRYVDGPFTKVLPSVMVPATFAESIRGADAVMLRTVRATGGAIRGLRYVDRAGTCGSPTTTAPGSAVGRPAAGPTDTRAAGR